MENIWIFLGKGIILTMKLGKKTTDEKYHNCHVPTENNTRGRKEQTDNC